MRPVVVSIAGSDCSGGAGIQADLKSIEACGGFGATVLTAVTAQNSRGVHHVATLSAELVAHQVEAVFGDLAVAAVKSGMLASAGTIDVVARALARYRPAIYVLDPVLAAESGEPLLPASCIPRLRERLLAEATLVTPNAPEAEALTGLGVRDLDDAERAARALLAAGARAVLLKGGHLSRDHLATDLLVTPGATRRYPAAALPARHARGTGCIYASAIATYLACGASLEAAVGMAKRFVHGAIRDGLALGFGRGPADPMHARIGRLHVLTGRSPGSRFGPVELSRLAAEAGADTIQLRDKRTIDTAALVAEARELREALAELGADLIVNDRADVAAAAGAAGVHLGASDLAPEHARRILGPAAHIGRTAHDLAEARQAAAGPVDYLGVGPVFGTASKPDPRPPLGLAALARIVAAVAKPVIAIGNIDAHRVDEVLATGVHGVAVLSAVAGAADPGREVARLREAIERFAPGAFDGRAAHSGG